MVFKIVFYTTFKNLNPVDKDVVFLEEDIIKYKLLFRTIPYYL